MQENWIGRSEGALRLLRRSPGAQRADRGLHDAARHARSAPPSSPSRPIIRWPRELGDERSGARRASSPSATARGTSRGGDRDRREEGLSTPGSRPCIPFDADWKLPVYVANFVLMEYGTGAIFGCPAHDQRDLDFARKYGLPVTPVVLPPEARIRQTLRDRRRGLSSSDGRSSSTPTSSTGSTVRGGRYARAIASGSTELGRRRGHDRTTGCATGACRASATGAARSRSSIAATCGIVPVPSDDLPVALPEDVDLRPAGQSARPPSDLEACRLPALRQAGAARDRHVRHLRRIRPGISCASAARAQRAGRSIARDVDYWLPVDQYIGGVEHAILHLLYSRFFTRAHAQDRLRRARRAVRRPVHPGHGHPRDLSRRRPATGCCRTRSKRGDGRGRDVADGSAGRRSAAREDVQVEEERGRPRRRSSRPTAPTRRAGSCSPTARPSAISNGPRPASRAPGASCSGSGA